MKSVFKFIDTAKKMASDSDGDTAIASNYITVTIDTSNGFSYIRKFVKE